MKEKVCSNIDEISSLLIDVSKEIYDNPEVAFEEVKASQLLAKHLKMAGFEVELGVAGMETAIRAMHPDRKDGPTVAILAEYDALPEIGHGCAHNLIAAAALGASLGLGAVKKDLPGTLIFLGTPAEEDVGGKIVMVEHGLFEGIDAAMMFHPSAGYNLVGRKGLAMAEVKIQFHGKTSHASASPEKGINALDAVIQTFNGISALRQHIKSTARIHGVITNGGVKPNIVPDFASAHFYVRALDDDYCEELLTKVENCAKGAAIATGATLKFEIIEPFYKSRKMNKALGNAFAENLGVLGEGIDRLPYGAGLGSSDIGNVSQVVPSIHPYISICDKEVAGHSKEFAEASISKRGNEALIKAAKALAMTAIDMFTDSEFGERVREEFERT